MSTEATSNGAITSVGSSDALIGMAALGKTAAALALVVATIFLCSALLKRWTRQGSHQNVNLNVVGSTAVGNRERVVIVDVEGTWLVLGVGNGHISKLHELSAPKPSPHDNAPSLRFSQRLAKALQKQRRRGSSSASSDADTMK
ncbi:flagellar biosynthetic protein FliO [Halomonas llamarensis]|uniref:Flagellar protein n=1 Tax=Halomonas llamarensis TaxID=2945104 RepID=A0ABT0SND0_9GAMM|nr:flagellar biosynthetic protein FliO [Halomonas llamarensis]MCL7929289.1 flagellar biosynthetic protein FliO [Halomonas llamarensis]